jgi:predicted phage tail protein
MANRPSQNVDELIDQLRDIKDGITANIADWTAAEETEVQTVHDDLDTKKADLEAAEAAYNTAKEDVENYVRETADKTYVKYRDLAYGKYGKKEAKLTEFGLIPLSTSGTTPEPPAIPDSFKAVLSDDRTFIKLSWNKPPRARSFELWYAASTNVGEDESLDKMFLTSINTTSFKHIGIARGTKYYYWLKSKGSTGDSDFSPPIFCVAI